MNIKAVSFFLLLLIFGCVDPEEVVVNSAELYFDIPEYVDQYEAEHDSYNVIKEVTLNNKTESKNIDGYNLSKELELMKGFDINKPSMGGKYDKQEIQQEDGSLLTTYTAKEPELKTQSVKILRNQDKIEEIKIEGAQKTILSENKQTIIFAPEKSFNLVSEDKNRFGNKLTKEILIKFI